jgi:hypothetical protein
LRTESSQGVENLCKSLLLLLVLPLLLIKPLLLLRRLLLQQSLVRSKCSLKFRDLLRVSFVTLSLRNHSNDKLNRQHDQQG